MNNRAALQWSSSHLLCLIHAGGGKAGGRTFGGWIIYKSAWHGGRNYYTDHRHWPCVFSRSMNFAFLTKHCTQTHTFIHTHTHTHTQIPTHTVTTGTHKHAHSPARWKTETKGHSQTHLLTHAERQTRTHTHVRTHAHTHQRAHKHTHTHTQTNRSITSLTMRLCRPIHRWIQTRHTHTHTYTHSHTQTHTHVHTVRSCGGCKSF